jgi:hypothetical protein
MAIADQIMKIILGDCGTSTSRFHGVRWGDFWIPRMICSMAGSSQRPRWRKQKTVRIYIRKTTLKLADWKVTEVPGEMAGYRRGISVGRGGLRTGIVHSKSLPTCHKNWEHALAHITNTRSSSDRPTNGRLDALVADRKVSSFENMIGTVVVDLGSTLFNSYLFPLHDH